MDKLFDKSHRDRSKTERSSGKGSTVSNYIQEMKTTNSRQEDPGMI